ncbi:Aminoacylase-1 [Glycine soja]|uniref:N-acyl-aliphatic-L-amino acid amidohydrolase n=1 Tax=Glycine soja TaxID=3848 RepID=A0A445H5S0_GLYSO|nr:Aminoacylase-1 [Glycine soja]
MALSAQRCAKPNSNREGMALSTQSPIFLSSLSHSHSPSSPLRNRNNLTTQTPPRSTRRHSHHALPALPPYQHGPPFPRRLLRGLLPQSPGPKPGPQNPNPRVRPTRSGSNPFLLLNSHLDSVPAEPEKWLHPPFSVHRTSSGAIFARGSQDDKCITIQYLEAIRNLKSQSFTLHRTIHISLVPDEEIGGFDSAAKFVESEEFDGLNVGFALGEGQASPGDEFRVFYSDRVPWNVKIRARGLPEHGSRMYDGSAMENLMESVEVVNRFMESQFDVVKAGNALNAEVVSVNPGFVMNVQPLGAEAGFDLRLTPTTDAEEMRRRIAKEWAPAVRNMSYEGLLGLNLEFSNYNGLLLWCSSPQGLNNWPEILASTTNARYLKQKGIPVLSFSPMKNTPILLHDHNEHLKDIVFMKGIQVYEF